MTNAEKFQEIFKEFATEVWAFPEKDFLTWLNAEYKEPVTKNDLGVETTQMIDKSNFSQEQYKSDLQSAYDCGYAQAKNNLGVDCIVDVLGSYTDLDIPYKREIAENILANLPSVTPQNQVYPLCEDCHTKMDEVRRAYDNAMKQEPQSFKWCTDCKEYDQEKHCCHRYSKVIRNAVAEIRQEPKTGHWIIKDDKEQGYDIAGVKTWYIEIMCSECGFIKTAIEGHTWQYHYCPNCGCCMVELQESEDKE